MKERTPKPVIWGWVLTGGVFLFAVVLGFIPTCDSAGDCQSKFAAFWSAPPNEIGDTLAGFAGALAFIWIIVTVMLQSKELKAQREELRLTRTEMEEQRKATQDMALSMKAQAEIFEDERRQRHEATQKEFIDEMLLNFSEEVTESKAVWKIADGVGGWTLELVYGGNGKYQTLSEETFFRKLRAEMNYALPNIVEESKKKTTVRPERESFLTAFKALGAITEQFDKLPKTLQLRFYRLHLFELFVDMQRALESDIWTKEPSQ